MKILLHDESAKGHAVVGTPSTVLDIDGNGNLRVVHRGKAHEDGMVATAVLCRTGLTAGHEVVTGQGVTGAAGGRGTHAGHHISYISRA